MTYALASGLHACVADRRLVLLSLPCDRYWMLPAAAEAAALRALTGKPLHAGDAPVLERLAARGLLRPSSCGNESALCTHPMPSTSMVEQQWERPALTEMLRSWFAVIGAMALLRLNGLEAMIDRVRASELRRHANIERISVLASSFAELRFAVRTMDRCLPLSVALAVRAKREDEGVRLVLGVAGNPFAAHAWVQHGACLLNDRLDAVAGFTPILAV